MRYVLRPLALLWRYWPQLAALYLLGLLGRRGAIELAAWAGYDNDFWAAVIMPFAGLARLGSYVAMFLVLRPGIPVLVALPRRSARHIDVFSNVIVPFFAIYLAWQMFVEDWIAFEARALDYRLNEAFTTPGPTQLNPETLPVSTVTWVLIIAALIVRYVLGWLKERLPQWMITVRVYVDALWVFLAASFAAREGLELIINPTEWLSERRIVVWFNNTRSELFSHFQPLETLWDAAMSVMRTVLGGATIPLLWLAVAGIIYGVAMPGGWRDAARRVAGGRADRIFDRAAPSERRFRTQWSRIPGALREKVREWLLSQLGKFRPIADSARLILHAGVLALALYVLGYLGLAWLDMTGSFYRPEVRTGYLLRGVAWLLGPHPLSFWSGVVDAIALIAHVIIEPLRVCLIASMVAYCLEHVRTREPTSTIAP